MIVAGPGMGGSHYPAPDQFDHYVREMAPVTVNWTLIVEYLSFLPFNCITVLYEMRQFIGLKCCHAIGKGTKHRSLSC